MDRKWFDRLMWSGIAAAVTMPVFGFGGLILAVVLIAYWRWAPDGMAVQPPATLTPAELPGQARNGQLAGAQRR